MRGEVPGPASADLWGLTGTTSGAGNSDWRRRLACVSAVSMRMSRVARLERAYSMSIQFTWVMTRLAREMLGDSEGANRPVEVILLLSGVPGLNPSAIAQSLGVSRSTVSHLVNKLEVAGLIERRVDRSDRRGVQMSLTAVARARVADFRRRLGAVMAEWSPRLREMAALYGVESGPDVVSAADPMMMLADLARVMGAFGDEVLPFLAGFGVREQRDRHAVSLLHERGPQRPAQLARDLEMTTGGVNAVIDRLQAVGLVERSMPRISVEDRRAVLVELTPRGLEAATGVLVVLDRHARAIGEAVLACAGRQVSSVA